MHNNAWISFWISLKFIPKARINNILTLVQIMAPTRRQAIIWTNDVKLPTHMCVTRPQWVEYPCVDIKMYMCHCLTRKCGYTCIQAFPKPFDKHMKHNEYHCSICLPGWRKWLSITYILNHTSVCVYPRTDWWVLFNLASFTSKFSRCLISWMETTSCAILCVLEIRSIDGGDLSFIL